METRLHRIMVTACLQRRSLTAASPSGVVVLPVRRLRAGAREQGGRHGGAGAGRRARRAAEAGGGRLHRARCWAL